jgi:hypothetical protein
VAICTTHPLTLMTEATREVKEKLVLRLIESSLLVLQPESTIGDVAVGETRSLVKSRNIVTCNPELLNHARIGDFVCDDKINLGRADWYMLRLADTGHCFQAENLH